MKILVTSDLHQWIPKWKDLVKIVGKEKPRFILIAGDLLPKTGGYVSAEKILFRTENILPGDEMLRFSHGADIFWQ